MASCLGLWILCLRCIVLPFLNGCLHNMIGLGLLLSLILYICQGLLPFLLVLTISAFMTFSSSLEVVGEALIILCFFYCFGLIGDPFLGLECFLRFGIGDERFLIFLSFRSDLFLYIYLWIIVLFHKCSFFCLRDYYLNKFVYLFCERKGHFS